MYANMTDKTGKLAVVVVLIGASCAVSLGQATGMAAFLANNGNLEGSVTSYGFAPDGSLIFVDKVITGQRASIYDYEPGCNAYSIALSPNGRYLATGHASSDDPIQQITILEVADDGTLSIVLEYPAPDTPMDVEWISDRYLAALRTELGITNQVITYEFDPAGPSLTEIDRGDCNTFTTSLALHPSGKYLYAGDSMANAIYFFNVGTDGTLTAAGTYYSGATYPLSVIVSPDGTKLYAFGGISSGGHAVLGYHILADGTLSPMSGSPFYSPGSSPKDGTFSVDSSILFVGHGSDATVRSFLIDPTSGALTYTGNTFDVGIQGELGDLKVLGDYLLVSDNYYYDTGLYSFTIGPDGSMSANGGIVSSQGIGPREIAGWLGVQCPADLDGDGQVGLSDLALLLASYNLCAGDPGYLPDADLDHDGCVNLADLSLMLSAYGPC